MKISTFCFHSFLLFPFSFPFPFLSLRFRFVSFLPVPFPSLPFFCFHFSSFFLSTLFLSFHSLLVIPSSSILFRFPFFSSLVLSHVLLRQNVSVIRLDMNNHVIGSTVELEFIEPRTYIHSVTHKNSEGCE